MIRTIQVIEADTAIAEAEGHKRGCMDRNHKRGAGVKALPGHRVSLPPLHSLSLMLNLP